MDEETKRIIAKAARDHAKYEAQFAGLTYASSTDSETDSELSESGSEVYTTEDFTTTGTATASGPSGGAAAAAVPTSVVTTFDEAVDNVARRDEAAANAVPEIGRASCRERV